MGQILETLFSQLGQNDMGLITNAGVIKFTVNGAERMRINNNGVDIGSFQLVMNRETWQVYIIIVIFII